MLYYRYEYKNLNFLLQLFLGITPFDIRIRFLFFLLMPGVAFSRDEERLVRWLLTVSDRLESEEFPLTQEFISQMLGVRRAGVTEAASTLSQAGMIT